MTKLNNKGFTIIEFLVYFTITTMLALTLFAILTSFWQTRTHVFFGNRLLAASEIIFENITHDLHNSQSTVIDFNSLTLNLFDGTTVVYSYDPNTRVLSRDLSPLHPTNISISQFSLIPRSASNQLPLIEIGLKLESNNSQISKAQIERSTTVSLRTNRGVL